MTLELAKPARYRLGRVVRHLRWGQRQGFGRLIEEDELNPLRRARLAVDKRRWRRRHRLARGSATPVLLVGVQRSGTNMIVRGLESSPEFEVHNENDNRAFERFQLRPLPVIQELVESSGHRYVLLKPLCDSHRTPELLDGLAATHPGKAIWAYRGVDGRVRSAVAKFGTANRDVLREIAAGRATARWQAQRLPPESLELIRSFDYDTMSAESAAALFWLVRNRLYFELGLDRRQDVLLASYDATVAQPEASMQALCAFLGVTWDPKLAEHVAPRARRDPEPVALDPRIRQHCDELTRRLDAARAGVGPAAR